jgi:Ca-activated chloride channel family protein
MRPVTLPAIIGLLSVLTITSCIKQHGGSSFAIQPGTSTAKYSTIEENPFIKTTDSAVSTFSIDADGASYATLRHFINTDRPIVKDAIRSEEFVNYFTYNYTDPGDHHAIAVNGEVSSCPWQTGNKLIRIGIKGKSVTQANYPPANFVLLIDVSGSMGYEDKLETLKKGFNDFVDQMRPQDKIAIVTYAGKAGVVLNSTPGTQKNLIKSKINGLKAGGSTNGEGGIKLAYQAAQSGFIQGGNNRVILGTDGDFNVGVSSTDELIELIKTKRNSGIFLTALGIGSGNLNEDMMEKVANKGNGNYEYIDSKEEIRKIFIEEYNKFLSVAKDVKVQVTFNPALVEEYRLIGYENRLLTSAEFDDDEADAGEIGAGQTITAIYEIKPVSAADFRAQPTFNIDFRYKRPAESTSNLLSLDIYDNGTTFGNASENMRFAASLIALGMHLRNSNYKGTITMNDIRTWAGGAMTFDPNGYRRKHIDLLSRIN